MSALTAVSLFEDSDPLPVGDEAFSNAYSTTDIFNPEQSEPEPSEPVLALDLFRDDEPQVSFDCGKPGAAAHEEPSVPVLQSAMFPPVKRGRGRPKKNSDPDQQPKIATGTAKQKTLAENRKRRWSNPPQPQAEQGSQDRSEVETEVGKLRQLTCAFFTSDKLRSSSVHIGDEFGLSRYFIMQTQKRLAAGAVKSQDSISDAVMSKLLTACDNSQNSEVAPSIMPQLHMRIRQYDETPIQLKIASGPEADTQTQTQTVDSQSQGQALEDAEDAVPRPPKRRRSGIGSSQVQNCKLFLTEQRTHSLFLAKAEHGEKLQQFVVEGQVQTPLQVLASNKAHIMASALHRTSQRQWDEKICGPSGFKRLLNVVTTDDFAANHLAERMLQAKEEKDHPGLDSGLLHVTCDVHKVHGIAKSVFAMNDLDFFTSGLIKAALTLRGGALTDFKSIFRKYVVDHLEIHRGEAACFGQDPAAHRSFMLDLFFSDVSESKKAQLNSVFNGDWQSRELIHYCNGCCESKEHTLEKTMELLPCFVRAGPKVFPRHKWLGADVCIDWFAKFAVCHQMLKPILHTLLNGQVRQEESVTDLAVVLPVDQGAGDSGGTNADDFKQIYKQWRKVTLEWGQLNNLAVLMVFSRLTINPQGTLMAKHLKISSSNWDQEEHLSELTSGRRQYRMLWCFQNQAATDCISEHLHFLNFDFASVLPVEALTVQKSHCLFRLLVRSASATHHYLFLRHMKYPYRLFGLLDPVHVVRQDIAIKALADFAERPCILDTFTKWFIRQHCVDNGSMTVECLLAPEPLAELRAIAKACAIDIASTECQHASNRR